MMKRISTILFFVFALGITNFAFAQKKKAATGKTEINSTEITWMSLEEVQAAMKKKPKKVYIDVYTDWCGWCKVMDKKTFTNPNVIKYLNENFYSVKLNAEKDASIDFLGRTYTYPELATTLMRGQNSYPTTIILQEQFENPQPIPGYLDVNQIEKILKYLNEGHFKTTPYDKYEKEFKNTWM